MAFHKKIQKLLLIGVNLPSTPLPAKPVLPTELAPLVDAITSVHQTFNLRAMDYGHRYRSAFWAIYLLSALAVLCACLPLALGWDNENHDMNHYSIVWVLSEVLIILAIGFIYWRGHQQDWQGQWLKARTTAEFAWYLPLIAPLVDFDSLGENANWYNGLFEPEQQAQGGHEVDELCRRLTPLASSAMKSVWSDAQFVISYARWAAAILEGQCHYHRNVQHHQHALLHRVHAINSWLFGLTAVAALSHLVVHSKVLTLITTFFPALGASLHGALAQSEAYRLEATSARILTELQRLMVPIRQGLVEQNAMENVEPLRASVLASVALILDEHQDWHMLVRPHHLPLG